MRHRLHGRGGAPPLGWMLTRGLHRTLVAFLVLAAAIGGAGATAIHHIHGRGVTGAGLLCLGLGVFLCLLPIARMATMRIVWPLRLLASSAVALQHGRLLARGELPATGGEVGEVAGALRSMADRVARQLQDQRALMAAVSHELRSPLARARVLVELSREGAAPPEFHDDLQEEIDRMDELISDLLAAARIDFEAVSPRALDPRELVRRALEIAGLAEETLVELPARPVMVEADPTLAARALSGLLDNARRYGGTTVAVRVKDRGAELVFEVEDDGPGFQPGEEEAAFAPFWRGPAVPGRERPRGEGLGLALVRQIAEAHRGKAGAERRPEGGARVWLTLPIAADPTGTDSD